MKKVKPGRQIQKLAQYLTSCEKTTQEVAKASAKKIEKKAPDELYKDILEFQETSKVSIFKNKRYQVLCPLD